MPSERHTINGKLVGVYYNTAKGNRLYLAHRKRADVYRRHNAWCFDTALLERLRGQGIAVVGVVRREGKLRLIWLTWLEDFFLSPHAFAHMHGCRQRALPLAHFRIDPNRSVAVIEAAMRVR